jgi:hypothetical protein
MKTYPLMGQETGDRPIGFEIDSVGVSTWWIARLLARVDGVTDVQRRRPFAVPADIKVEFKYSHQEFVVWEPWADNSRYWIVPKDPALGVPAIDDLENAFRRSESLFIKIFLDVFTLRPIRRLFH